MFEQLREELQVIKDRKFHLVPAPGNAYPWEAQIDWPTPPPSSGEEQLGCASVILALVKQRWSSTNVHTIWATFRNGKL
jgi:hypothetical protein